MAGLGVFLPILLCAANYPFPQNQAQPHLVNYPAYNNAAVQAQYNAWYAEQVTTTGAGPGGGSGIVGGVTEYQRIQRNGDPTLVADSTVSEGIGYGMIIAVYMNEQGLFDDLWNYEQEYLDANGLMNWYIDPSGALDGTGAATDADEDMAWALVMAHYQWGDASGATNPAGTEYDYTTLATNQITAIYNNEVEAGTYVPKPGDSWGGSNETNPSYFDPAAYKVFAQFTGNTAWLDVANEAYTVLFNSLNATNGNQSDGLDPAWCDSAGATVSGEPANYQYDACRTPFRVLKDWAFFGDARAISYTAMNNSFFVPIGAGNIVDGYALNGAQDPEYDVDGVTEEAASFVGPATCAAMNQTSTADVSFVQTGYDLLTNTAWAANHLDGDMVVGGQYYDQSWAVLSLLMMSGNYLDYAPLPTPTATPTPVPTVNPCQTQIRVDCGSSSSYTSAATGLVWAADQQYTPGSAPGAAGSFGYVSWAAGTAAATTGTITGTSDPTLYLTQRYGTPLGYDFSVPNGPATVTFYWAETYATAAGQRVFSVAINGTTVESGLDLYSVTGGQDIAYSASFPVTVTNGVISVSMTASANNALIQAISVAAGPLCTSTPSPSPTRSPSATATPDASSTPTASATLTASPSPSASDTPSPSSTPTSTATPSGTGTATLTFSGTPSASPSPSASDTPSATATATATPSGTASATPTSPASPSASPNPSASDTPLPSATPSGTPTEAIPSPTPDFSPSPSPLPSPSPSWTATAAPSPSASPSASASPTGSVSPSGTASATPTASIPPTASPTPTATASASGTDSDTSTPSSTETGTATPTPTATPSGTGTPTGTPTATLSASASPTLTPTPSPSATALAPTESASPTPAVSGSPSPTPSPKTSPASAVPVVLAVLPVPNPNPSQLAVEFSAPARAVQVQVFTKALVLALDFSAPAPAAGWNPIALPPAWDRLPDGLYFVSVRAAGGGNSSRAKFTRAMILR